MERCLPPFVYSLPLKSPPAVNKGIRDRTPGLPRVGWDGRAELMVARGSVIFLL